MTRCTRLSSLLDVHSGFYYGKALRGKSFFHKLGMKFKKRWIKRSFFWKKNLIPFLFFFFLRINNSIALNYNRWSRWWMLFDDSVANSLWRIFLWNIVSTCTCSILFLHYYWNTDINLERERDKQIK